MSYLNRLKSAMSNEYLETLMLMAIRKKILIEMNNDKIIISVKDNSKLLL